MARSAEVEEILRELGTLRAQALEEFHRSQGGLPPGQALHCDWTNQATGRFYGICSAILLIKGLHPDDGD